MPFNSQNHTLALAAICSKEGLVLDVPPSGKLVVCSGDTLRCVLRLKDPTKIESLKIEIAGYQVSAACSASLVAALVVDLAHEAVFCPGHQKHHSFAQVCGHVIQWAPSFIERISERIQAIERREPYSVIPCRAARRTSGSQKL
jgi:hypothetical protein